jgi:NADH-quinone oxidoreductase subunit I
MVATVKEIKMPKKPIPVVGSLKLMYSMGKYMFKKPVTTQYPEDKGEIPERLRFRIFLVPEACVGCTLCSKICPNHSIKMEHWDLDRSGLENNVVQTARGDRKNLQNKRNIYPDVNFGTCTVCRQCEEICPTDAIYLTHQFENARTRNSFTYSPQELTMQEEDVIK